MKRIKFFSITAASLFFLIFNASLVFAHTDPKKTDPIVHAEIVQPDTYTAKSPTIIWLEVKDKTTDKIIEGLDVEVEVHSPKEMVIFTGKAISKPSEGGPFYIAEVTFPTSGEYEIHYKFLSNNIELKFEFPVFVAEQANQFWNSTTKAGMAVLGLLGIVTIVWGILKKKLKTALILLAILAAATYGAYAVYVTKQAGSKAIVTCTEDGRCFVTGHWHTFVLMKVCGEEKNLPANKGPLGSSHTHQTEKDVIHWHDKLPYDKASQKPLDTKPLTLGALFDVMEIPFDKDKIFDKKNGDLCSGDVKPGTLKVLVNGQPNNEFRDYVWKDRDIIYIVFDGRSIEEVQKQYQANPPEFPGLGTG